MPIYEYQCSGCGKVFEVFQKISDKPLTKCKFCKGELNKLISNCAFHLKGTGWYVTDYKKPVDSASGKNGTKHVDKKKEAKVESTADLKKETPSPAPAKTETKTETTNVKNTAATTSGGNE